MAGMAASAFRREPLRGLTRAVHTRVLLLALVVAGTAGMGLDGRVDRDYARELRIVTGLGIGGCMDAAVEGDTLYVVGGGTLYSADISQPRAPRLIGRLGDLGNVRQIEVADGIAYVTARSDGLFIVDVREPAAPALLARYDTVGLATGIAVDGPLAAVACRHCGVEFVDVSDPANPRHLGLVRAGEAQSVDLQAGFAYVAVWETRELVVCDCRDPRNPSLLARAPLDGFGDGVFARGDLCFAGTGHHARGMRRMAESGPAYGAGRGLEIFDLSDPAAPRRLSRIELPRAYKLFVDMWDVQVVGDHAFVGDTFLGVFALDVSDPAKPVFAGRCQLPDVPERAEHRPVDGFAVGEGMLYVAGAWTDLHVVEATGLAGALSRRPHSREAPWAEQSAGTQPSVYSPSAQVHAAAFAPDTDLAYVAAGSAGLHVVRPQPRPEAVRSIETEGVAFDVAVHDRRMCVAEGSGGLTVWDCSEPDDPELLGRYVPECGRMFQVAVPDSGRYALCHVGESALQIVDISRPQDMRRVLTDTQLGLLYRLPLADGAARGRYTARLWHVSGFCWYDLAPDSAPAYAGRAWRVR